MNQKNIRIGDQYHHDTRYRRDAMPQGGLDWANPPSPYKGFPSTLKRIRLQTADPMGGDPIWQVIAQRRSVRDFSPAPISFWELSQLLWATQGVTWRAWGVDFRAAPSAGALYPIETYVVVNRVEELVTGLYHYQVREGELVVLREGDFGRDLARAGLEQEMLEEAACVFAWTAMVGRSKWKYRERAYRYIYMDAGHVGQNFYLAAAALNLGCCTVGAFFDEEVDRLIGVDGKDEISVYLGAVGKIK